MPVFASAASRGNLGSSCLLICMFLDLMRASSVEFLLKYCGISSLIQREFRSGVRVREKQEMKP
jgi:hypothetical protein